MIKNEGRYNTPAADTATSFKSFSTPITQYCHIILFYPLETELVSKLEYEQALY